MTPIVREDLVRAVYFASAMDLVIGGPYRTEGGTVDPFRNALVGRLGEIAFRNEAVARLGEGRVGDLDWAVNVRVDGKRKGDGGADLVIDGWRVDVKTSNWKVLLWPECVADLFPFVSLEPWSTVSSILSARAKGLDFDVDLPLAGASVGWISRKPAMARTVWTDDERTVGFTPCEDVLAEPSSLWQILSRPKQLFPAAADDLWTRSGDSWRRTRPTASAAGPGA